MAKCHSKKFKKNREKINKHIIRSQKFNKKIRLSIIKRLTYINKKHRKKEKLSLKKLCKHHLKIVQGIKNYKRLSLRKRKLMIN